jgi:hypothetical protein
VAGGLSLERSESLSRIRDAMARGEYLLAFDESSTAVDADPLDAELQFLAVLSLARAGASDQVLSALETSDLEARAADASPALQEDIAALRVRLSKDRALTVVGERRKTRATTSRRLRRSRQCGAAVLGASVFVGLVHATVSQLPRSVCDFNPRRRCLQARRSVDCDGGARAGGVILITR